MVILAHLNSLQVLPLILPEFHLMHTDSNRYSPYAAVVRSVCWCLVWRLQCVNVVIWKMTFAKSFNFADWEPNLYTTCTCWCIMKALWYSVNVVIGLQIQLCETINFGYINMF
jgi:hypothetical protein